MKKEDERGSSAQQIPWWAYLTFAILAYPMLYYIIPFLAQKGSLPLPLIPMARQAAPIIAIIFLLLAANALYKNEPPTTFTTSENRKEDN